MSSMHHFQKLSWSIITGTNDLSKYTMNILVFTVVSPFRFVVKKNKKEENNGNCKAFCVTRKRNITKCENKNTTNEYRYFLASNFVGVNNFFILDYWDDNGNAKRFKARGYYLPKGIIKNHIVIVNGKDLYHQSIYSNIKTIQRNNKVNNWTWQRLYYKILVERWIHKKIIKDNIGWFK